jgi:hypothetical protein
MCMRFEVLLILGYTLDKCVNRFAFLRSRVARRRDSSIVHADITLSVSKHLSKCQFCFSTFSIHSLRQLRAYVRIEDRQKKT